MNANTIGIVVDYGNISGAVKGSENINDDVLDYSKLISYLAKGAEQVLKSIYIHREYKDNKEKFISFLQNKCGFTVISKEMKIISEYNIKDDSQIIKKCNLDVEITIDLMDMILQNKLPSKLFFVTGDSDFAPLVSRIKKEGTIVCIVSSFKSLSHELKLVADEYMFLENIWSEVCKKRN